MKYTNFVKEFRVRIQKRLSTKTGWGRLEVMQQIDNVLLEVATEALDQKEFGIASESG